MYYARTCPRGMFYITLTKEVQSSTPLILIFKYTTICMNHEVGTGTFLVSIHVATATIKEKLL